MILPPTGGNGGADAASILRRAVEIGADRAPHIANLLGIVKRDPANRSYLATINLMLDRYEAEHAHSPNHLAPPPSAGDLFDPTSPPDFEIGTTTETGVRYGPRIKHECGTIVLGGITGGGKTSAVLNIIEGTFRRIPQAATIVFDVKGDYTCLAALHPGVNVIRVRSEAPLRLIAPPAGVSLDSWLATFSTIFCEYRGLKKSRHILLDTLTHLCVRFGVDQVPSRPWPSLHNVLEYLVRKRGPKFGKEAEYRDSLINELRGVLGDSGGAFDTCDGVDIETLLKPGSITVLQMENLPAPAQQLLICLTTERIIARRAAAHMHNSGLDCVVMLDESQIVLGRAVDLRTDNGIAPIAVHLLRAREFGVGFVVVAHLLPEISHAVLSSARTMLIVGGLSDGGSIAVAGQTMNLSSQVRSMIPRLGRGQALVREIGLGSYTDAFLVDLDPPRIAKGAIDEPTRRRMMAPRLAAMPTQPSQPLINYPTIMAELNTPWTRPAPRPAASGSAVPGPGSPRPTPTAVTPQPSVISPPPTAVPPPHVGSPTSTSIPQTPLLPQAERDLLFDAARHRDDYMLERAGRLKIADYKALQRTLTSLQSKGLAIEHRVRLGRSTVSLLEVTQAGWQTLGMVKPRHYIGRGGFVHTVLIARLERSLNAKGWTQVQTEFPVGLHGHPVDLFGRSPAGIPTALEVTLSTSNVVSNAVKSLTPSTIVQDLIFLCTVRSACLNVEALLRADPAAAALLGRIHFDRIDNFL